MVSDNLPLEIDVTWLSGFTLSTFAFFFQMFLYFLIPCSRKLDQKILTQMTVARLLNVVLEYLVMKLDFKGTKFRDPVFALYLHTDAALICWMFVFTKNLYDKVIHVFSLQKLSFALVSLSIWILMFPVGLMCPLLLTINDRYFSTFYDIYGIIKFIVLTLNLLFFCRIFYVALKRTDNNKNILKTCIVSFILFSITSFQVFVTDLLSYFYARNDVALVFCAINSYQVIAITIIFTILVNGACEESLAKTISQKLKPSAV